jgi:hypothetical protein
VCAREHPVGGNNKNYKNDKKCKDHNAKKLSGMPTATIARLNAIFWVIVLNLCPAVTEISGAVLQSTEFLALRTQYGSWKAEKTPGTLLPSTT